jgi:hypothetical protein
MNRQTSSEGTKGSSNKQIPAFFSEFVANIQPDQVQDKRLWVQFDRKRSFIEICYAAKIQACPQLGNGTHVLFVKWRTCAALRRPFWMKLSRIKDLCAVHNFTSLSGVIALIELTNLTNDLDIATISLTFKDVSLWKWSLELKPIVWRPKAVLDFCRVNLVTLVQWFATQWNFIEDEHDDYFFIEFPYLYHAWSFHNALFFRRIETNLIWL